MCKFGARSTSTRIRWGIDTERHGEDTESSCAARRDLHQGQGGDASLGGVASDPNFFSLFPESMTLCSEIMWGLPPTTSKCASPVRTTRPCGPLTPLRRNKVYSTKMKYNRPSKLAGNNIQRYRTTSHNTIFMFSNPKSSSFDKNFYQV